MQHTTTASEAPCQHCRRPVLYAWDEGRLVRADAPALHEAVAAALRAAGRRVFVLTAGRYLVHETPERVGTLRLLVSRHSEHVCHHLHAQPRRPVRYEKLELFDHESVRPPAHRDRGNR